MRFSVRRPNTAGSAVAFALIQLGCAGAAPAGGSVHSPVASAAPSAASAAAPASPPSAAGSSSSAPHGVAVSPRATGPRVPEIMLDPKQPLRPLPELKVENIGLHIGGGPNDAETKAPFLSAVAERFPSFMDCYRKSEDPAVGGRFGIDLHIARTGGHARLEQPRTALRGAEFRACLSSVFEAVEFQKPKKGPTTISYSLRFQLVEAP
ncbi:MAG: hypothetical protein ABUL62_16450 [Myxococcales bacterium]